MPQQDNETNWQYSQKLAYFPIFYEGALIGFGRREVVSKIVKALNDEPVLRKALQMACYDMLNQSGMDTNRVDLLVKKYISKAERPRYGSRAIAAMLRDRQEELNVSDQEFVRFCDSYKISPLELQEIYAGEEIVNSQLGPLSRILAVPVEELMEVRDGPKKSR
jgi:hypothetical protein